MTFLFEYGLFLAKALTFILTFVVLLVSVTAFTTKQQNKNGELELTDISKHLSHTKKLMQSKLLTPSKHKELLKKEKKEKKEKVKVEKKQAKDNIEADKKPQLFVIDFKGSIDAKEVSSLREELTAILSVATKIDEVFVRLESGGGMVHGYGLCASQLQRIKDHNIKLTISVDKVAASGGYMMACVADKIIAAPFAILGSIGVIAQIPNFNKLLKKHDVEFEQLTAGQYKRTLTMFGENDDEGRNKFKEELQETHDLFKHFVSEHRSQVDLDKVATGEHWYGLQAIDLDLVDKISTSDDYLISKLNDHHIVQVKYVKSKKMLDKLGKSISVSIENSLLKLVQINLSRLFK